MAHSAAPEANSNRKVALLYVLDSALKSGKARELKLKDKDPGMAKSMQRFCNAVAAGLPALLRATQNDPSCYDKTLKVRPRHTLELSQDACVSALCFDRYGPLETLQPRASELSRQRGAWDYEPYRLLEQQLRHWSHHRLPPSSTTSLRGVRLMCSCGLPAGVPGVA